MKSPTIFTWVAGVVVFALASPALAQQPVPEIDSGLIQAGLSVLVGGLLVLNGWRRH
jgi:hypothetical protein